MSSHLVHGAPARLVKGPTFCSYHIDQPVLRLLRDGFKIWYRKDWHVLKNLW